MPNKLTIDTSGKWERYAGVLPDGAEPLGTVTRPNGDAGALVRLRSGVYVQLTAGAMRTLPQKEIEAELLGDGA